MRINLYEVLPAGLRAYISRLRVARWVFDYFMRMDWFFSAWYGVRRSAKPVGDGTWVAEFDDVKLHLPSYHEMLVPREVIGSKVYEQVYSLCKGDVVIDVGAHIGVFSVRAAKIVGEHGLVVAIEPEPRNQAFLQENIASNGLEQVVKIIRGAAGARQEKGRLYLSSLSPQHSFHDVSFSGEAMSEFVEVTVDSLDNIVSQLGLKRVNFVKIDTEGWELEVLSGMQTILGSPDIKIAIAAYHTLPDGRPEAPEILSYFRSRGIKETYYNAEFIYART